MMSFPLEAAAVRADAKSRPMVKAFLEKIHTRPAYQAALRTGGQYDFAN
jgi:glutathione S-transferase